MNRVNFKNVNTKSVDQSYFKPKVKISKEVENIVENRKIFKRERSFTVYMTGQAQDQFNNAVKNLINEKYNPYDIPEKIKPTEDFTWEIKANNNLEENINNLEVATKVEKVEDEIVKTLIDNDKRSYQDRGYNGWHGHFKYTLNGCKIKISDNVGGCSVQQLYDWGNYSNNSNIPKLLKHVLNDLNYGVGIVLCQVGSMFYKSLFCKTLEELGFKYHEEYKNHQHGGRDTGRIYSLIINKNEENKRVTTEE